jgi:hypothetical protein
MAIRTLLYGSECWVMKRKEKLRNYGPQKCDSEDLQRDAQNWMKLGPWI